MDTALGILIGLVISIIANLLTPFVKPLWGMFLSLQRRGYEAQIQQQIRVLKTELDQVHRNQADTAKDLLVYLFQWSLGIFALFVIGVAFAFVGLLPEGTEDTTRGPLFYALVFFIAAAVCSAVILATSRTLTTTGMSKRIATLEEKIPKLVARLLNPDHTDV